MQDLADQIRRRVPDVNLPTNQGGKVFGLSIADPLAKDAFRVPRWMPFTAQTDPCGSWIWTNSSWMVRSNAADEDWVDPGAGAHTSVARGPAYVAEAARELLGACGGVVLQGCSVGVGLVVDLGWSELLQRNVLRVAIGLPSRSGSGLSYTSPTWDNEALVGLFDAHTGEAIVDLDIHYFDVQAVVRPFVDVIVPRLIEWGIDFGLQFELIGSLTKGTADLVQVRPSPGSIQGQVVQAPSDETPLVTTGMVNMPGEVLAEVYMVLDGRGRNQEDPLEVAIMTAQAADREQMDEYWDPLKEALGGKIVFWPPGTLQKYGGSMKQAAGAWWLGAVAQISERAILTNSAHGMSSDSYLKSESSRAAFEEAKAGGPLLGIGRELSRLLRRECRGETPPVLHIVSDGLVGQVYRG